MLSHIDLRYRFTTKYRELGNPLSSSTLRKINCIKKLKNILHMNIKKLKKIILYPIVSKFINCILDELYWSIDNLLFRQWHQ